MNAKPGYSEYQREWYYKNRERVLAQRKTYRENNKEKIKEYNRISREKRKEEAAAYSARYYQEHKERIKGRRKLRYQKNKAAVSEQGRIYREKNKEKVRLRRAKWKAANRVKCHQYWHKRYAASMKSRIGNQSTIIEWESSWRKKKSVKCYWCETRFGPSACHCDHVVPISKGGSHSIENLCISCAKCNTSKGVNTLELWNTKIANPSLF
jgi:5-methylcytosine-specific restriction endonuclease McrA